MSDNIVVLYCITDDLLKAIGHRDDCRCNLTDAEVITTALTAALYFGGNLETSRTLFCRRLHLVADPCYSLFYQLGLLLKQTGPKAEYLLDSFPVAVCDNIRIARCRIVRGEQFRGKCVARRRYFYGVKVQVLTTACGIPVEFAYLPGRASDTRGLDVLPPELRAGSEIFMDSGYTDYAAGDAARGADGVVFSVCRKKNSKRRQEPPLEYYKVMMRKRIETVFSQITNLFPRHIHTVTFRGFLMKISFFIIFAFTLERAFI
jgi:hypothetical protein